MLRHFIKIATLCLLAGTVYSDTNYRLNIPFKPSSYSIAITPYFDTGDDNAFTFDGEVVIKLTSESNVKQIKLHSEDLSYTASNITVSSASGTIELNATNALEFEEKYTFVFINLQTELQAGVEYTVRILYRGPIRNDLNGFYRNYYLENGVKKWLGATQMEPTHARKVFPCFDEPALKATFTLTIDRPSNYKQTLANTKLLSSVPLSNGYVRELFYPTPVMSTYLVAFLVSEFEAANYHTNGTKEFGIFTRPEAINQSAYAFDFGRRIVNALGDYFQIDYYSTNNYLKLDHIALPDFRAGAMENWGLIKYRESYLMYVPEESTPTFKYRVAQIIAHETTHMWFGNLVTCHWWSNTWLNEGFANYFQDYITSLIEPEVASENNLVIGSVYDAYTADEVPTSPAITNDDVNSPAEISGHFGLISYQKAGSVIRMMHHLIGDEAFRTGLHTYLTANQFDVGYPDKMYSALDLGASSVGSLASYPAFTVSDVMSTWVSQAGHPILEVNVDYEEEKVTLSQKRFYTDPTQNSNEIYKIPITYTTEMAPDFTNTKPAFIMDNETYEFTISNISDAHSWVLFNIQETAKGLRKKLAIQLPKVQFLLPAGFYRVNYDDHSWEHIAIALKGEKREQIHKFNRAKIVNDLFAFLYGDVVNFNLLYTVLDFLTEETEQPVWYAAIKGLNKLRTSYYGTDVLKDIDAYALSLMENIINKLGYEVRSDDDYLTLRNRMQVLEFACKLGHEGCVTNTVALFNGLKNGTEISPSLRPVVYCNGLRYGDGEDYDFLWQRMSITNVANEARTIGEALGCTNNAEKLKSYLVSMSEENSPIRTQDLILPLTSILANYDHVHTVLHELQDNYALWSTIYPSMDTVLTTIASALRTEEDFDEFESFLSSCTECTEQAITSARTTLAQSKASTQWADDHKEDILQSLKNHATFTTPSSIVLVMCLVSAIFVMF